MNLGSIPARSDFGGAASQQSRGRRGGDWSSSQSESRVGASRQSIDMRWLWQEERGEADVRRRAQGGDPPAGSGVTPQLAGGSAATRGPNVSKVRRGVICGAEGKMRRRLVE